MERDGSRAVAGEAVVAEEGTGFRRTTSVFTIGRFGGFVEVGGLRLVVSRREGRPRSIMVHFSAPWVHCSPLNAVVEFQTPKRVWIWRPLAQYSQFDKEKEALRPKIADLSPAGSKGLISRDL